MNLISNNGSNKLQTYDPRLQKMVEVCDVIEIKKVYENTSGELSGVLTYRKREIEFTYADLCYPQIKDFIARNSIVVSTSYIKDIHEYLVNQIASMEVLHMHNTIGWSDDFKCFYLDESIGAETYSTLSKSMLNIVGNGGSKEEYIQKLKKFTISSVELQTVLLLGLSAPLYSYLDHKISIGTQVASLIGSSTTGKSTAASLLCSVWGNPRVNNNGLFRTFNDTDNYKIEALRNIHGIPIVYDDSSSMADGSKYRNPWRLGNLCYSISEGQTKGRCDIAGNPLETHRFSGLVTFTGESGIADDDYREGIRARLVSFNDIHWTKSADQADDLKEFLMDNYGFMGKDFMTQLIARMRSDEINIRERHKRLVRKLQTKVSNQDSLSQRRFNKIAVILLAGELANELIPEYGKFNMTKITEFLVNLENLAQEDRDLGTNASRILTEFYVANKSTFTGESQVKNGWTEIELNGKWAVYMLPSVFEKVLKDNNIIDIKKAVNALAEIGLLKKDADNVHDQRKSPSHLKDISNRCYKLVF